MIPLPHMSGKTVGVLGLGASGLASAKALTASGAAVLCWDDGEAARVKAAAQHLAVKPFSGADVDLLISSPGIPLAYPAPNPITAQALEAQVPVVGDVELFAKARAALPEHKVVGITGTNGKSTTTALIAHCLQSAGLDVQIGGNFGPPILSLDPVCDVFVLELSSFQLEITNSLDCDVAVFLNLSPDHGDRYASMNDYAVAKQRLFDMQRAQHDAIIAVDDAEGQRLAASVTGQVIPVSGSGRPARWTVRDGALWFENDVVSKQADWPALKGHHNAQNAAAAAAACHQLGLSRDQIAKGLASYEALAHRSQCVAQAGQLSFINDSKATNPEAAAQSLTAYDAVYWLAGGSDKGSAFDVLLEPAKSLRGAYFFGQTGPSMADALGFPSETIFNDMKGACDAAVGAAQQAGGPATILLSPACASFDQFKNFADRGDAFTQLARGVERQAA
ncbi:MAG: UDP-N-acetylmuramoyl-L-alanine--D-glutamate ligase [Sphingomonadales bacterium]